jgi:hypothetical protein
MGLEEDFSSCYRVYIQWADGVRCEGGTYAKTHYRSWLRMVVLSITVAVEANGIYKTQHHAYRVETLFGELNHPWGLAFLPDGRILVTEQAGELNLLDPAKSSRIRIKGVPEVAATGHGGLLDIALHPNFDSNSFELHGRSEWWLCRPCWSGPASGMQIEGI